MHDRQFVDHLIEHHAIPYRGLHGVSIGQGDVACQHRLLFGVIGIAADVQFEFIARTQQVEGQLVGVAQFPDVFTLVVVVVGHLDGDVVLRDLFRPAGRHSCGVQPCRTIDSG